GKENRVNILKSINEGPFQMGTLKETLTVGTKGALHLGPERPRVHSDLTSEEKDRNQATIQDGRVVVQNVQGRQNRGQGNNARGAGAAGYGYVNPGETIHDYYVRFAKLINDMRNIKMTMSRMQLNSKFVNNMLPESGMFCMIGLGKVCWLSSQLGCPLERVLNQVEWCQQSVVEHMWMVKSRNCTQPKRPQNSEYFKDKMLLMQAQENGVTLDEEQLLFIVSGQDNVVDDDVDEQLVQDLALNVDNVFQADNCDTFNSDVDEAPTAQTMFMANLSSVDLVYDEAGPSYDSDVLSEVHDHDHYQDDVCEHHEVHEMHDDVQPNYVVNSHTGYTSDSNMISYDPYVKDNTVQVVQSDVSAVPNDAYMMILNDMHEPPAQHKENQYLEEILDMKALQEKVEDRLFKQDQSLQIVHMLCKPKPYYDEQRKAAIGYKSPLCLARTKQVQPALYNCHEIIKTDHVSAIVHNSEDTLEIAEIPRKKMNEKIRTPLWTHHKINIRPLDYSKENFLTTFTPQTQLTLEQIFWSKDVLKMKTEALKEQAKAAKPIKALTVYPPNTPVKLVPRVVQIVLWYLDSGCSKHMTGVRSRLRNFVKKFIGTVRFGNDHFGAIMGYGDYVIGDSVISRVLVVPICTLSVEDMMKSSPICLLSKAFKTKSRLWHHRLNHLNFGTINDLARKDIVRGLPRLKFEKDHLCSACQLGKSKKHTHSPKIENTNLEVLNTLHMDLSSSSTQVPPTLAESSSPLEDLIENLTNMLALLTQSYRTFIPQTNNQLRTSSNARNQATLQDGRVVVQNVQGRPNR
nr:integrase, catalytic region, zinc finger, CCHC-type, peptidase aspartic, catalytic [Tanacetum cinerariifolium]